MRSTFLCLAAIAQLVISSVSSAEPIPNPLERRTNNDGVFATGLKKLDNGLFVSTLQIGTPPQNLTVVMDSSSGYSWVRGYRCKTENCLGRTSYSTISSKTSEPTGQKFSVKYGASCVDTHVIYDTMSFGKSKIDRLPFGAAYRMTGFDHGFDGHFGIGPDVDLNAHKLSLAPAANWQKRDLTGSSGYLGNAYQQGQTGSSASGIYVTDNGSGFDQNGGGNGGTLPPTGGNNGGNPGTTNPGNGGTLPPTGGNNNSTTTNPGTTNPGTTNPGTTNPGTTNPGTTSPGNGEVSSGGFGFGFSKRDQLEKRHNKKDEHDGYLIIGGVMPGIVEGDINYLPMAEAKDGKARGYDIEINRAKIGKQLIMPQAEGAVAAISTSSPYIVMPKSQAEQFQKTYGGKFYRKSGTYSVKCSEVKNLPVLKITLDNKVIQIPANYWTRVKDLDRDCCEVLLAKGASETNWILGTPFTTPFYTVFDPLHNRIGFGIKKGNKNKELKIYDA
ncbi:aspartic peptidase domain-containing protein [Cunninghamella echinulata]|nr:aspartic peptidase domain-containing protein [Cunninghamella echinulata]